MFGFDSNPAESHPKRRFGDLIFQDCLPNAVQTLEDNELRTLLIALLREWRDRTQS